MRSRIPGSRAIAAGLLALGLSPFFDAAGAVADPAGAAQSVEAAAPEKSTLDKLWGLPVLYRNEENPYIEEFDLTGRLQLDYFNISSTQGANDFFEIRRFRLGIDSWYFQRHLELRVSVDTALRTYNTPSVFYNRFTDFLLYYHVNEALNFRAGKFEPHFGYDREFSDTLQKFFERSFFDDQVFNQTGHDYVTGASVLGHIGNWGYQATVFSDSVDKLFGQFDGGASELFELSYDFSRALEWGKALWALDFLTTQNNANSDVFNTMRNVAATYFDAQMGRFGLMAQVGFGNGTSSKGNLCEFQIMPCYYVIANRLEAVLRYQYGGAELANGITTLNRQVHTLGSFTGDNYNSVYVGLNYYIFGQKCKLMVGEQFDDLTGGTGSLANYRGWTTLVGFRMFW